MNGVGDILRNELGLTKDSVVIVELFLVVLGVVVLNFLIRRFLDRIQRQLSKTKNPWDDAVIEAAGKPLTWLVWVIGVAFAIDLLKHRLTTLSVIYDYSDSIKLLFVIGLCAWFLVRLISEVENNLIRRREKEGLEVDQSTVHAISKLLRMSVVITTVLVTLQTFNINISGILAFGGIGGIAVGFAAKDLLANFFGGLMIYLDRPFSIGDWIRSPDRNIEGTVENIGWRQTRIRTFDQRPLYVPNNVFTSIAVENPSRMYNRRIYETIGIRYADADKLTLIVGDVKKMLQSHPEIDTDRTLIVNFNSFAASSLDFFVYTFTKTTNWVAFHEIKQDVLLKIYQIIIDHGAEVAFPTSTLHIADPIKLEPTEG